MTASAAGVAARALELTTRERDPALLLAALHQLAHDAVGARVSVVLERAADGDGFVVSSASGLETSPLDRWCTSEAASAASAQASAAPRPLVLGALHTDAPELGERLRTPAAFVARLSLEFTTGLLVLGTDDPSTDATAAASLADAFSLALETAKRRRDWDLERDLRQAMLDVSGSGDLSPDGTGISAFCGHVARLLGADGAELWHLDRESRELVIWASSDGTPRGARRIPLADAESAAAAGLARSLPTFVRDANRSAAATAVSLSVPLRGRRRAIGALVLHGLRLEPGGDADLLARAEHAGRQLSALIESGQLLDDVVRSRRQLAQSEKLLALGQFVAGIAHELNNPLQGVLGHVELLRASPALPPSLKRDLALVHREADRAARIVRHLLVFAGSGRLAVRRLSVNALVARVLRLRARPHRAAGIDVVRGLDGDLPRIAADRMLLQQAVLNIVLNAEQAMAGGGTLTVRTRHDRDDGTVHIEIEDTGPGLPEDVRARLFEPFFTTKDVGAGTGLGLAIAYGIVRAHGGTLDGDNRATGGARFTVTLPVRPPNQQGVGGAR